MKARKRYRIAIEDESRLRLIASASVSPRRLWAVATACVLTFAAIIAIVIMATPIRTLMPGYLRKDERTEAKAAMMRIDSIRDAYSVSSRYIANILTVLDTDRTPTDSLQNETTPNELPPDSLLPASPREIEFIRRMKDRELYNVSIVAPLAADQLRIFPVADGAVIAENSANLLKPRILTAKGRPVCAVADGRVLAIQNPAPEGGAGIVIQHDSGFASRYSHLGTPTVAPGAHVDGGSVIAHASTGGATGPGFFYMEMWYDGNPLEPGRYLGASTD